LILKGEGERGWKTASIRRKGEAILSKGMKEWQEDLELHMHISEGKPRES